MIGSSSTDIRQQGRLEILSVDQLGKLYEVQKQNARN